MENTIKRNGNTLTFYKPFFTRQWRWRLRAKNGNIIGAKYRKLQKQAGLCRQL